MVYLSKMRRLHYWLIRKVVGRRQGIIMNVEFIGGIDIAPNQYVLVTGNVFDGAMINDIEAAHCLEIAERHEAMYKAANRTEAAEAAHYIGNSIHARIGSLERARKEMKSG